jgi:Zn ribbon nucleic-acid-binding protein
MRCPKCSKPSEVVKVYQFTAEARRRRECVTCGFRFTTSEKLWRRVYADEIKGREQHQRAGKKIGHKTGQPERYRKTYSNFDVVALEGYDMDYEDVSTYVHVGDD